MGLQVCVLLDSMLRDALDPQVDTSRMVLECQVVMRAAGALVRRHAALLPVRAGTLLAILLQGCR